MAVKPTRRISWSTILLGLIVLWIAVITTLILLDPEAASSPS
ncbi:MAG TPA: hypothetical protein VGP70_06875 [Actinomadura sp.]|jgi:hypothetical protein|nr:hypothetical protein [Actinomadura sp.]